MLDLILFNSIWVLPFLTVLFTLPIHSSKTSTIKGIHLVSAAFVLAISLYLTIKVYLTATLTTPDASTFSLHFVTQHLWWKSIGASFFIGADALSLVMVLLTAIVVFTGILVSWSMQGNTKIFFALIQILGASVYGVFISFDLFLLFVFYEMEALCMYLMIGGFGSGRKDYGGKKLSLTLALGSSMVLAALIGIYLESGLNTWNLLELGQVTFPMSLQIWAFPLLFMGFAVSGSLFPFHFWSPDGHSAAPTAVSMLAAGVMMKMGPYACLRVAIYLMPEAAKMYLPYIVFLLIFNVILSGFIAIRHKDLKYITAYSSISHLGLIFLGIAAMTFLGFRGAVLQMLSHGLLTALFFATIGMVYSRTHTRDITQMSGLMKQIPFIGVAFVIAGFACLGLPGLSGFIAEASIFIGAFQNDSSWIRIVSIFAILSITITAIYVLRSANRFLSGPLSHPSIIDANFKEKLSIILLVIPLFFLGLFPSGISEWIDSSLLPIYTHLMR
ncbi:MAG: NADH-quinone oxidoreductase subunit M [Fibrobacter sp.]|nr:NADH-quinone oxidoreductase subunit M [Fibrobacter sp.]